jgi:tellurite resistance protein
LIYENEEALFKKIFFYRLVAQMNKEFDDEDILRYAEFLKLQEELEEFEDFRCLREAKEAKKDAPIIGMIELKQKIRKRAKQSSG